MNRHAEHLPADFVLRLDCPDRPGIVACVAVALRDCGCNIEESAQFRDSLSGRFFMRTVFRPVERSNSADLFSMEFQKTARTYGMDWRIDPLNVRVRTVILVSKADHCLNDILYRWRTGHLPLDIAAVIGNHPDMRALAQERGLPFHHLPVTPDTRAAQEGQITEIIEKTGAELIVLARYMQVLSDRFCTSYPGRVINIHHSFLPGFKGARPYHQAWERGVKIIGATAHFATADLDEGPIIDQETTRIDHTMPPEKLQVLGRDIESQVLSRAITAYCERRIFLHGNRTIIL